jgi:hypothetical protein
MANRFLDGIIYIMFSMMMMMIVSVASLGDSSEEAINEFKSGSSGPDNSAPIRDKSPDEIAAEWTWWKFERIPERENPFKGDKPFPWKLLAFCICIGLFIAYGNSSRRNSKARKTR